MKKIISMGVLLVLFAVMLSDCKNTGKSDDGVTGQDLSDGATGTKTVTDGIPGNETTTLGTISLNLKTSRTGILHTT